MEAGPLGTSGYRLRSREDEGSRAGEDGGGGEKDGEGGKRDGSQGKSHLLSLILCEMFPW